MPVAPAKVSGLGDKWYSHPGTALLRAKCERLGPRMAVSGFETSRGKRWREKKEKDTLLNDPLTRHRAAGQVRNLGATIGVGRRCWHCGWDPSGAAAGDRPAWG